MDLIVSNRLEIKKLIIRFEIKKLIIRLEMKKLIIRLEIKKLIIRLEIKFCPAFQIAAPLKKATINLSDCLACSGCVTSAEEVLVNRQSSEELRRYGCLAFLILIIVCYCYFNYCLLLLF